MTRPATAEPTSPGSSSPTPPSATEAPGVTVPPLGIRPTTPSQTTTTTGSGPANGSASAAGAPPSDPLDEDHGTRSESRSDTEPLNLKDELKDPIRGAVLAASLGLHKILARTEYELAAGLWLMDEDEAAGIADPLAAIAKRHAGGLAVDNDTADLIRAGASALGYLAINTWKAVTIRFSLRRARRAGVSTEQGQEQGE